MKSLLRNNFFVLCFITIVFISIPLSALSQDNFDINIEDIKGKVISNIEDTTILRLLYGNYLKTKGKYYYNLGPQSWNNMDSTYMTVENVFGDSSTKIFYVRGAKTLSSTMHNYYNEIILLLNKNKSKWIITDVMINNDIPDYCEVDLKGIFGNIFLITYTTCGVYGDGIYYKRDEYKLIERNKFLNPRVFFITESNNGGSGHCQCDSLSNDQNKYCYNYIGEVKYAYDDTLKSFVFDFFSARKDAKCDWKNEKFKKVYQQWYINSDTAFQSRGNLISEWADHVEGQINLKNSEIDKRLKKK